ncbi:hypothetical protein NDU88_005225 [Pleurodeles waltl]|uniref:Uncharacterized protein n=1 Tax=Pleurodeles waltl TaxID=8319 RepID=A0AAV7MVM7_PLEWA|nr:hypothetical protein NDU88_005225 [Pleurodeles waltl]
MQPTTARHSEQQVVSKLPWGPIHMPGILYPPGVPGKALFMAPTWQQPLKPLKQSSDKDQELHYLIDKLKDREDRSRRDNVCFFGIAEQAEGVDTSTFS